MEKVMGAPHNRDRLEKFVRTQLYTDTVPLVKDKELAQKLVTSNRRRQSEWFQNVALPSYVVVAPDGTTMLAAYEGLEQTTGEFSRFLDEGYARWQSLQNRGEQLSARPQP